MGFNSGFKGLNPIKLGLSGEIYDEWDSLLCASQLMFWGYACCGAVLAHCVPEAVYLATFYQVLLRAVQSVTAAWVSRNASSIGGIT